MGRIKTIAFELSTFLINYIHLVAFKKSFLQQDH